jgi:RNA polymerase I-specific transcription initiation factor RRN7
LRHQIWFLIREKGLPAELETVVQDLWTLRILQLENKIGSSQGYESQSDAYSATEESESESEAGILRRRIRDKKLKRTPTLIDSLALCYLGILTLRLPVTPGDIHSWLTNEKLAYMRAIKLVPPAMREKLPASYHAILDPRTILSYERFYSVVNDLKFSLQKEYGIVWPSLNHPLLLFRLLKDLALPLELYDATVRLAQYLGFDFTFPTDIQTRLGVRHLPEAQLIACLVVSVKLFYPFDDTQRFPQTSSEPAAVAMDWDHWYRQVSTANPRTRSGIRLYTPEELMNLQEKDAFSMSGEQLDQYLAWYQDSFIEHTVDDQSADSVYRNALYELFPVDGDPASKWADELPANLSPQERLDIVKAVHSAQKPQPVVGERNATMDMLRPGSRYRYYKRVEDLSERARRFYEEAGRVMGLSLEMLVISVFFTEKKIAKWQVLQRQQAS